VNAKETYLPRSGPMPRPESLEEAAATLRESAIPNPGVSDVAFITEEFTSLCPLTGQPDFCTLELEYVPDQLCLESKSLKFYVFAFREHQAFTEAVAVRIAEDVDAAIAPKHVRVQLKQRPRGGLELVATASRSKYFI
jgi:7-cyano-7-deazaguanine reductase